MVPSKQNVYDMAYRGKTTAVKILVNENDKLKTQTDENGRLLIHWAALGGYNDLVIYLLSIGQPVDAKDDMEMTPLILAASGGREEVVRILLKEGANVNAKSSEGHSALQYSASKNWKSICVILMEQEANVNISDNRGATPLHRAASKGNTEIVRLLLESSKINIDKTDMYGNTALHLACEEDRQEEAKMLVANGADPLIENKERKTPVDLATFELSKKLREVYDKREQTST